MASINFTPINLKNKIGLVMAGLLGLTDVLSILAPTPDGETGPPCVVLAVDCALGILTLAAVVFTWRTGNLRESGGVEVCDPVRLLPTPSGEPPQAAAIRPRHRGLSREVAPVRAVAGQPGGATAAA